MTLDLFDKRALLFLPASNPRAIAHARESDADLVILDLEDAVKPENKVSAREAAVAALKEPWPMPVAIRVNGSHTEWHGPDVVAVMHDKPNAVVVPRVETKDQLGFVRNQTGLPVLAMIETARGVLAAAAIGHEAAGLIVGTNDLSASLRLPPGAGRQPLQMALQHVVLAARAQEIAVFDGVYNQLDDLDGFASEALESRRLGFDGKSLIHPSQIAPCHAAFAPTEEEIARAERLVAASTGGAQRFEGGMIEQMHVQSAERLLRRAGRA
ncbi:CoA ester lyase [Sphingomonas sp. RB56-2]|uniref:CoA ester lyase n=1 Tax=Sphingomonas brevis TaxID=2908206 RepID=A0ABT0S6S7_9SPHN|nr:CoA ester lyase [Sphingomonas brevis]MCL6740096.1 CoA ester lyase [Sphingomonas brevis]